MFPAMRIVEETTMTAKKGFVIEDEEVYIWKPSRVDDILFCISGLKGIDPSAIRLYVTHWTESGKGTEEGVFPKQITCRGFDEKGDYIVNFLYRNLPLLVTVKTSKCPNGKPTLTMVYSELAGRLTPIQEEKMI